MKRHYYTIELRIINLCGEEILSGRAPPNRLKPESQTELEIMDFTDFQGLLDVIGFVKNQIDRHAQTWWDLKLDPKFAGTVFDKILNSPMIVNRTWHRGAPSDYDEM
jgi:hypothetical protein